MLDEDLVGEAGVGAEAVELVVGFLEGAPVGVLARAHVLAPGDPHVAASVHQDLSAASHVGVIGLDDPEGAGPTREAPSSENRHPVALAGAFHPAGGRQHLEGARRAERMPLAEQRAPELHPALERGGAFGGAQTEDDRHQAVAELDLLQGGHPVVLPGVESRGRGQRELEALLLLQRGQPLAGEEPAPELRRVRRGPGGQVVHPLEQATHAAMAGDAVAVVVLLHDPEREQESASSSWGTSRCGPSPVSTQHSSG